MSLLQKASIITTPTAYAEDYLYSIKPAYALGSELIINGNFANGTTNWTATNAVISASDYVLTVDDSANAGGDSRATQSFTTRVGFTYKVRFNRVSTTSTFFLGIGGGTGYNNVFYSDLGTDLGFYEKTFVATSTTSRIALITGGTGITKFSDVSVKEITDADFDFDRNSTGTRVNEDYLIEDVPYNLINYSEDFSVWSKEATVTLTANYGLAPDGTQTATRMQMDANDSIFRSVSSGNTFSVHIKGVAGETIRVANGTTITHTLTGRWDRVSVHDSGDSSTQVTLNTYSSATARDIEIWGAQVVKGDQPKEYLKTTDRLDIPRIDYTNGEPSILLEPSRTNLIANNSTANGIGSATVTNNYGISPEGLQNSIRVVTTGAGNNSGVLYSVANTSTTDTFTYSIYVKGEKGKTIHIRFETTPYSLQSQELFLLDGTWQKFTKTIDYTGAPTHTLKQFYLTSISSATATDFQVYGAQAEVGSYSTSLIHTSGTAVTRSADLANNAGNSDLINSTEGVLYTEIKPVKDTDFELISLNDGTTQNVVTIGTRNNVTELFIGYRVANSYQALFQPNANHNEFQKIALSYKANEFKAYINGTQVGIDTFGSVLSANTLKHLSFNLDNANALSFAGNLKMVAVFKEALTDLELEKLTGYNNHELYMNYYNRLSYLGLVEEYNVESDINNYIL